MSAIPVIGLWMAAAIGFGLSYLIHKLCRVFGWKFFSHNVTLLFGAVLMFVLVVPCIRWTVDRTTTVFLGMNPQEGEQRLDYLSLPPNTTSDFCYRLSISEHCIDADFGMSELDFLGWMENQHWKCSQFDLEKGIVAGDSRYFHPWVEPIRSHGSPVRKEVKRGYSYWKQRESGPGYDFRIVYDLVEERVYVHDPIGN